MPTPFERLDGLRFWIHVWPTEQRDEQQAAELLAAYRGTRDLCIASTHADASYKYLVDTPEEDIRVIDINHADNIHYPHQFPGIAQKLSPDDPQVDEWADEARPIVANFKDKYREMGAHLVVSFDELVDLADSVAAVCEPFLAANEALRYILSGYQGERVIESTRIRWGPNKRRAYIFDRYRWELNPKETAYSLDDLRILMLEEIDKIRRKMSRLRKIHDEGSPQLFTTRQPIPEDVQSYVWRRDGGRCRICHSEQNLQFDHVIPFSKGGSNEAANIQILCADCNNRKGDSIGGLRE